MAKYEFTMVTDAMMRGLMESGATASEMAAYIMLVRGLPIDRKSAECWMPADMAEKKVGMNERTFSKMLRSLCGKTITTKGGKQVPVLTKLTRGCKGHCPHYEDTLGKAIANGTYPPSTEEMGHQTGTQSNVEKPVENAPMGTQNKTQ